MREDQIQIALLQSKLWQVRLDPSFCLHSKKTKYTLSMGEIGMLSGAVMPSNILQAKSASGFDAYNGHVFIVHKMPA